MEHQKILNSMNGTGNSKFVTWNWNMGNDQSNTDYGVENEIIFNTEIIKSNLCDYNHAYILVRRDVVTTARNNPNPAVFHDWAPFITCNTKIDDADLDLVMLMYSLIEYSSNYSETIESLWFYLKNEATDVNADIGNDNNFIHFKCKLTY